MRAFLDRLRPFAPLTLRLMLAALAISFAMGKVLHGIGDFTKQVTSWGLKPWWAQALAWGALSSGFLMILGFATRLAAIALAVVTGIIIWKTRLHSGWSGGLDFSLLTLAACLSVALSGAGRPSVDSKISGG
jgi:putative oxidoreductase